MLLGAKAKEHAPITEQTTAPAVGGLAIGGKMHVPVTFEKANVDQIPVVVGQLPHNPDHNGVQ